MIDLTPTQWNYVLAGYCAVSSLGLVVLGSLLDRARNELRDLKRAQERTRGPRRPEQEDFDRLHLIRGRK